MRRQERVRRVEQRRVGRRLVLVDVERRAAEVAGSKRVRDSGFVDHAAAGDVEEQRALAHAGQLPSPDQTLGLTCERNVDRDDVGARQQVVDRHQLDAEVLGLLAGDVRVRPEDRHLHRPRSRRDRLADLAEPDDPERLAAQLDAGELRPLPLTTADGRIGGGDTSGEPEHERQRVLGGRDRVAGRGIDDDDARTRGCIEIDVVDTDARAADDDEVLAGADQVGVDLDLAPDEEGLVVGQDLAELRAREARSLVDLVVLVERRETFGGDWFRDQDFHAAEPAGTLSAWRAPALDSTAARSAAPVAAPGVTSRPNAIDTSSITASAPRMSSSVTSPRWPTRKILLVRCAWPPARTRLRSLSAPLNAFHSIPSGIHAAVTVWLACAGAADRRKPRASRPARVAAAHAACRAKTFSRPSSPSSRSPSSTW